MPEDNGIETFWERFIHPVHSAIKHISLLLIVADKTVLKEAGCKVKL